MKRMYECQVLVHLCIPSQSWFLGLLVERKKYKNMSPNVDRSTEKVIVSTSAQTYSSFPLQLSIEGVFLKCHVSSSLCLLWGDVSGPGNNTL